MCHQVVLAHPDDCQRIAKAHIRKQSNFTPFLFQSIIATTNNEHWRTQREHLNGVFLPQVRAQRCCCCSARAHTRAHTHTHAVDLAADPLHSHYAASLLILSLWFGYSLLSHSNSKASLSKIFPTSWARAKKCTERLENLSKQSGEYGVQMHDFFLHEAQAQLQMALFGMDEEFMYVR